jgi:crossover junction endodeoxyribonuclease RuvC
MQKKKLKILGIDPGLVSTGYGLISLEGNRLSFIASGTITTSNAEPLPKRLCTIYNALDAVLLAHTPDEAAIEETFVNKNALSSLMLGHARGAAMLAVSLHNLPLMEYAATLVKKSVVGTGRAEKDQVLHMVKRILPDAQCNNSHEADALAVAICHQSHRQMASILRSAS